MGQLVPVPPDHPDWEKIMLRRIRVANIMTGIVVGAAIIGFGVILFMAAVRSY